jgi:anti-anti-sigma regulatory factor
MAEFTALLSPDHHHCTIGGEIDLATADQLDAALADLTGDADVDCTAVTFIGSTGFRSLDHGYGTAISRGSTFVVSGMSVFQRQLAAILAVPYVVER